MSTKRRIAYVGLLSSALALALIPIPAALAHGGSHGGSHGGFSGGHVGGVAHFSGGVSHFSAGHVGGWSGGHVGGWSGGHVYSRPAFSHAAPAVIGPSGVVHSFAAHPGTWNHAWVGTPGLWAGTHGAWNYWGGYPYRNRGFYGYGLYGWPWYGLGWGVNSWWPDYYNYSYAPYGDLYGDYYYDQAFPYATVSPASAIIDTGPAAAESGPAVVEAGPPAAGTTASGFYTQALAAFRQADYANAARLAAHATIDDPQNPNAHILAMLSLFALGQYRPAAMEAHGVAAMGHVPDWPTLFGFYQNAAPYTEQLRKLETFVREHPQAGEGHFLLGLQYLMTSSPAAAREQLAEAAKLTPQDTIAAKLLTQLGTAATPSPVTPR